MGSLYFILLCIMTIPAILATGGTNSTRPNIVFIIADDLGWNDVSFHGSDQILTPNIDLLGYSGIILDRYYSHCVCTPSRSALVTGKYAYATGMQGYPLSYSEDRALPITEKILPQYLKDLGYKTHLVGKWHLGSSRTEYLPTRRGFDTHFGYRGGYLDYYEYTTEERWGNDTFTGMGLYRNDEPAWDVEGYLTDVFNEEAVSIIKSHETRLPLFLMLAHMAPHSSNEGALLQAPPHEVRAMRHVESSARRIFAAMVKKLDNSVGDVIEALEEKGILNNTIIVFVSDNGAFSSVVSKGLPNYGSNWPLRGQKMTPFEGGVRLPGALWVPQQLDHHLFKGYFHVVDWLPTLLKAVGTDPPANIDGLNLWNDIMTNKNSSRQEIFDIDDYFRFDSIILGDFKLVTGHMKLKDNNYQGGGSLLGINDQPPSYENTIKNSKAYKSFTNIGRFAKKYDIKLRKKLGIECEHPRDNKLCFPQNGISCLYNIKEDPCETKDVSKSYPELVNKMLARLLKEKRRLIPRTLPIQRDPKSTPKLFNNTWAPFADEL